MYITHTSCSRPLLDLRTVMEVNLNLDTDLVKELV